MMNDTNHGRSRFLDLKALASLEQMRFTTRHRIEGAYSGRHVSWHHGGAGEFVEFREYSGGEDLRRLDWKVLARTGKPVIRLHQEETNLLCTLALDVSGSMDFGDEDGDLPGSSKREYMQHLATAMSHIIAQSQDQVGVALLDEKLREMLPPAGSRDHVQLVQEKVEKLSTRPVMRMADSLRDLFLRSRRRGVLLLMSDFLMEDIDEVFAALRLFRHRNWEVILLHLVHPDEERLPEGEGFRFEGMEAEGHLDCSPREIRGAYRKRFGAHLASVRSGALADGHDYRLVSTGVSYLTTLSGFLVERAG